jgi:carboxylesterase type B
LAGKGVEADGVANAGLYDQRFALEWVRQYIHLFGGDPQKVTVMGESAGGGSIMHQITAYGGQNGPPPFQRAILQSPAWVPVPYQDQQDAVLQNFLQVLGVSTIDEARQLPSDKLMAANAYQVGTQSRYGTFTYGPVVDGAFVPSLPGQLLLEGKFYRNVEVMVGHNGEEGLDFTSPNTTTEAGTIYNLQTVLPGIMSSVVRYILGTLYPPVFNGTYGYTDSVGRAALIVSDFAFQCNTDYLNRAFSNRTYSYMFSVPPALHGQDVAYTFYGLGGPLSSSVVNNTLAYAMQDYFTSFIKTGSPQSSLGPTFPQHGEDARLLNFGMSNITVIRDPTANPRCRWWQTAPY